MWIPPGQTKNAIVSCYIPPQMEIGTKDKITFTLQGTNMESQSAVLTVTSPQSTHLVTNISKNIFKKLTLEIDDRTGDFI